MHRVSIVYKSRHFYHLLKTQNLIALFISPDDYDITVNWKENANFLMFSMFLHFTEGATSISLLKKVFTTRRQNTLDFFQWLWLLTLTVFCWTPIFEEYLCVATFNVKVLFWIRFMLACCRRDFPSCFSHGL